MKHVHFCIILSLLFLLNHSLDAFNKPYVLNFSKNEYGGENKNWSIGEDSKGIMYFGNDAGLLEFDGIGWSLYQMPNNLTVRSLFVLSDKLVFTGGYEEFGRWDRSSTGKLVYTSLSSSIKKSIFKNDDFWKIWADDRIVYFQSFNSIFVYDYKKIERVNIDIPILFLTKVRNEYWLQKIGAGLYKLKNEKLEKIEGSDIFSNTEVRVILPYSSDHFLIGTATKGIYIYDGVSFKEWNSSLSQTLSSVDLNCGLLSSRGTYVFGSILNGIYEVDKKGKILDQLSTDNILQNNTVLSIFEDNQGDIWAGLDRGISYIQYSSKMSIHIDPRGNIGTPYDAALWDEKLFVGTNQGVFYLNKEDMNKSNIFTSMKLIEGTQGQVWSLDVVDGRLFCCHNRGFKEIHKDLSVSRPYDVRTGVYQLQKIKLKERDLLLLSTYSSVQLIDLDTGITHTYNQIKEPIISGEVDHLENVWLEHFNKGVYRCRLSSDLDKLEVSKYFGGNSGDKLPYKLKMFKAGGRVIFLGDDSFYVYNDITDQIVLNKVLNDCFQYISNIQKIVSIGVNQFVALTNSSIYKFYYDGYKASILDSYDVKARNLSFVNAYENVAVLNDSLNLICLDNGFLLSRHDLPNNENQKQLDIPFLRSFRVDDQNDEFSFEELSDKIEVPYHHNAITIQFSTKNTLASNYNIQYMLKGVDKKWSTPQKTNKVSFVRLPKGNYTLEVRAVDNLGNASQIMSCNFEVLAPWYKTLWAYIGYILFGLFVCIVTWLTILKRYRNAHLLRIRMREARRLRKKNEHLEGVVEKKNAELLTQTSSVIQRNELIIKIKNELEEYYKKQNNKTLAPLFNKVENLLNENMNNDEDWKMFLINFEQKHTNFFKKLKEIYPQLTANDLKLCACLRLNLDSKDIASLMNVSVRAVENSRSRLRKKLDVQPQQQLNEFFLQF